MLKPVRVRALENFRIWIRYADGVEGEVDPSHLSGKGVFKAWRSPGVFSKVRLGSSGEIEWPGVGDLCSDALYLRISGKKAEEAFPNLKSSEITA
jgi:hypothetical protein